MTIRLTDILREKALWLLLIIIALFFIRPLLLEESFFFRDIYKLFLPQKRLLQEFVTSGEWPLWERYIHGGHPYLAAPGNAALYPFHLLFLFFPLISAFNLLIILHICLCAVSMYLFVRVLGLSSSSAIIGSTAYTFCGLTLSQINLLHTFLSSAYLPLLFLCWHLFLMRKQRRWFVLAVGINVLRLLLVAPEQYVIGVLLLAVWTACYPYPLFRARSKFILWGLLNVFAFGIAAIQIVPLAEAVSQSSRGEGLNYYTFTFWSLSPWRLPELLFPQFSGYVDRLAASDYWGRSVDDDTPMTLILSIYWGCSLVFLAINAGLNARQSTILPRMVRRLLLLTVLLSMLLATGRYLPGFEFLYQHLPFIKIFRFPIKFLWFSIFPMALLASYAFECHWGGIEEARDWRPSRKFLIGLWSGVAFLGLCTAFWTYFPAFSETFHQLFFKHPGNELSQQGLFQAFLHTFAIWTLLTLLYQYRTRAKTRWQPVLLCGIVLVDLLVAGKSLNPTTGQEFYTDTPPVVERVKHHLNDGRLYRTKTPRNPILQVPDNHIVWGERWNLEVLADFSAASYDIPVIFHEDFDSLANFREVEFRNLLERTSWSQKVPLLSAAGVSVILTDEEFSVPGTQYLGPVPNRSNIIFHLYKNHGALGQAQFVNSWEYAESGNDFEAAMLAADFDPKRHVVLQLEDERSGSLWFRGRKKARAVSPSRTENNVSCQATEIRDVHSASSLFSFSVSTPCDGYVVLQQPFYPGWKASMDEASVPILRANLAFSAIFVSQGEHRIRVSYAPVSMWLGGGLSLGVLGIFVLWVYCGAGRKV